MAEPKPNDREYSDPKLDDREYSDDECDELMDWVAGVYKEGGNQLPTVDLSQIQVAVTPQGVFLTDSSQRSDL